MADSAGANSAADSSDPVEQQLTFNIKASNDQKYILTLPTSTSIGDVKAKLATSEYADIPADRIRLIYSGRVLKNEDTLATYNVKDGNTIHMVKGAQSNARQNPQATSSSPSGATPAVPTNIAAGTGNNPLAGLTGARYAGFHGLPNASMFGADGGMGAPPPTEEMLRMLDDPNFLQQMNEAMNNPAFIQMMENHPMMRDNPMLRNMIRNPEMRRMLFSPEILRMQAQMQRSMGPDGGGESFPAPGVTDTTPQTGNTGVGARGQNTTQPNPMVPSFFGTPPAGGAAGNPFAALFGNGLPGQTPNTAGAGTTPSTSPPATASAGQGTPSTNTDPSRQDPFANLFGSQAASGGNDPLAQMTAQMMQNPEMMRNAMRMFGMGGASDPAPPTGTSGGEGTDTAANPFAALLGNPWGMMPPAPQAPPDTRPPEERYAEQLRQLNDMGFYEFERNVQALRRSGGSVQGAIEFLLGGGS